MSIVDYQPTHRNVRRSKFLVVALSLLSILFNAAILGVVQSESVPKIEVELFLGVMALIEVLVIVAVIGEFRTLLPVSLGYSVFTFYMWGIFVFVWIGKAASILLLKTDSKDEKEEEKTPLVLISAVITMFVISSVYFFRFFGVMLVFKWARVPSEQKPAVSYA